MNAYLYRVIPGDGRVREIKTIQSLNDDPDTIAEEAVRDYFYNTYQKPSDGRLSVVLSENDGTNMKARAVVVETSYDVEAEHLSVDEILEVSKLLVKGIGQ